MNNLKKQNFRIQGKNFLLTFPKTNSNNLNDILKIILFKEKDLKFTLIAKEAHNNNTFHHHIVMCFSKRKNVTSPFRWDYIFNKHGDYQKIDNLIECILYIKKENNFLEWGEPILKQKERLKLIVDNMRNRKEPVHSFFRDPQVGSELLFRNHKQLDQFQYRLLQHEFNETANKKSFIKDIDLTNFQCEDSSLYQILTFIRHHLNPSNRQYKASMIHIWSDQPDTGKSSLLHLLDKIAPCYFWPDDNWFQNYTNDQFQFIIWDEFSLIGWKLQFLNRFFAGEKMDLAIKGGHSFKRDNPLIIMCSNQSLVNHIHDKWPGEAYTDKQALAFKTLGARIFEVRIERPFFQNYNDWIQSMEKRICTSGQFPSLPAYSALEYINNIQSPLDQKLISIFLSKLPPKLQKYLKNRISSQFLPEKLISSTIKPIYFSTIFHEFDHQKSKWLFNKNKITLDPNTKEKNTLEKDKIQSKTNRIWGILSPWFKKWSQN